MPKAKTLVTVRVDGPSPDLFLIMSAAVFARLKQSTPRQITGKCRGGFGLVYRHCQEGPGFTGNASFFPGNPGSYTVLEEFLAVFGHFQEILKPPKEGGIFSNHPGF